MKKSSRTTIESLESRTLLSVGQLDTTFGTLGKAIVNGSHGLATCVVRLADGHILVAGESGDGNGDWILQRYNSTGAVDLTFGTGGQVVTDLGSPSDTPTSLAVDSNGLIVVAGFTYRSGMPEPALARFASTGVVDASFGIGGVVIGSFGDGTVLNSVAIATDGTIAAGGSTQTPGGTEDFALLEFDHTGSPISGFGISGRAVNDLGGFDSIASIAFVAGNQVVAAGTEYQSDTDQRFTLVQYKTDGTFDSSFGTAGVTRTTFGTAASHASAMAVTPGGLILVAGTISPLVDGTTGITPSTEFGLARYTSTGILDSSFGSAGLTTTTFAGGDAAAASMLLAPGGTIIVGGSVSALGNSDFAIARYSANGAPDLSLGTDGTASFDGGSNTEVARCIAFASPTQRILMVGDRAIDNPLGFNLTRLNADGSDDTSFIMPALPAISFNATVVQADGKIIAAGAAGVTGTFTDFDLQRFNSDGTPDLSFGNNGIVLTNLGDRGGGVGVVRLLQLSNGDIIAAGVRTRIQDSSLQDLGFELVRYTANGIIDPTFGTAGVVTGRFGTAISALADVAIARDGKIVVAGWELASARSLVSDFAVARFNADGSPDLSFGTNGQTTTALAGSATATSVAVLSDGSILVGGNESLSGDQFAIVKYQPDGTVDPNFGTAGVVNTVFTTGETADLSRLAIDSAGKIVALGTTSNGSTGQDDLALARYLPNGALDPVFATGGMLELHVPSTTNDVGNDLAIQSDGKILVGATVDTGSGNADDFLLARFTNLGQLDTSFGASGFTQTDFGTISHGTDDHLVGMTLGLDGTILTGGNTNGNASLAKYVDDIGPASPPAAPLDVTGTAASDIIDISLLNGNINVTLNGQIVQTVAASSVSTLNIMALAGDDTVTIEAGIPPAVLHAGAGNDSVQGNESGDTLFGGLGNDTLAGGPGDDQLFGGQGRDELVGHSGNDSLTGGRGADSLLGGTGNDTLDGGLGFDLIFGGPGNDLFQTQDGFIDTLFGGLGTDQGTTDSNDLIESVE